MLQNNLNAFICIEKLELEITINKHIFLIASIYALLCILLPIFKNIYILFCS